MRNGVILGLTLMGILLLALDTTDRVNRQQILGAGCFVLAGVYGVLTRPRF